MEIKTINDVQKRFCNPFISRWVENNTSVIQTRNIMMIKEKRFKVRILKGRVIRSINGFMKKNKSPMAKPDKIIVIGPSEKTPGFKKNTETAIPAIPAIIFTIKLFII